MTVYNGDLTGRVIAVDADAWQPHELRKVIESGAELLNVSFDDVFIDALIEGSQGSVYVVQDVCNRACRAAGVLETVDVSRKVAGDAAALIRDVVNVQGGRYRSFLVQFAAGFQNTDLEMYRWLLYPIIEASQGDIERGLTLSEITQALKAKHPRGQALNTGNITQALQNFANLQGQKDIKPIVFDYDATNLRLNVVDRGFTIWLANQDRAELLKSLDLPTE